MVGQADADALVPIGPGPWQWGLLLVHVRIEHLQSFDGQQLLGLLLLGSWVFGGRRGRGQVRGNVECQQTWGRHGERREGKW